MELSSRQWQVIREICAEQARAVVEKNYKPNVQKALDLGFDQIQIEEMTRITEATARKHMKQMGDATCPTVFVPLNKPQTGRYAAKMLARAAKKIAGLESKVADLRTGNDHWQIQHQIALNDKAALQMKFDRQLRVNEELRAQVEKQSATIDGLRDRLRFQDDVGEASFRNHQNCRCSVEVVNVKHSAPALVVNDFALPHSIPNTEFKDGDKWVDLTGKEVFTWFMGQWRRKSELEGFASAKKYT